MAGRLAGKVAVVTGGGNGIGRATVLRFLGEGASVVIADLNEETGRETLELAATEGHRERARFVRCDVAEESDVQSTIDLAAKTFRGLDCVFNNAGVVGVFGPIDGIRVDDWDYSFGVLVRGVFLGLKHGARVMKQHGRGGSLINTGSVAGLSGGDGPQAYSAAKAAVVNLSRAVAVELAPARIRVNAICPGGILTPLLHRGSPGTMAEMLTSLQPWPEPGMPENIADAALYLASDESRFVTGHALVVDGGLTARGGNAMSHLNPSGGELLVSGVDKGSTGQDPILR